MNRETSRHGAEEVERRNSTMSVDSDSSAEVRLRWRNHGPLVTPSRERSNPFDKELLDSDASRDEDDAPATDFDHVEEGIMTQTGGDEGDRGVEESKGEKEKEQKHGALGKPLKLSFRERIRHFTWTWFTMTMATGGIANVLYTIPFRFHGLYALGCIFFILNMILFAFNITMISLRFYYYPRTFKASFLHPTESLFIPACVISFGTILINITQYGVDNTGSWLEHTMAVMYWVDCGLAIVFSIGIYLIMWSTQTFTISQMTPVWIFPAYPLLIIGPHAGNLAPKTLNPTRALDIIISGYVIQGIGFLVSLMIYSAYIYRLMTQKLPKETLRPGMFISVGPSGFTISGIVNMGQALPRVVPKDFMGPGLGEFAGNVSMICANWMGLWLWGLALWFFFVSVGAHYSCARRGKLDFAMTWYSFVFPNTALTTGTFAIAKALDRNKAIEYIGCAMAIGLIITWFFVFFMMVRAVVLKQILWPQKQEDRTEGGWKQPSIEEQKRRLKIVGDGGEAGSVSTWSFRARPAGAGEGSVDARVLAQRGRAGSRLTDGLRRWSIGTRQASVPR